MPRRAALARRATRFAAYATARVTVVTQSYRIECGKANANARYRTYPPTTETSVIFVSA